MCRNVQGIEVGGLTGPHTSQAVGLSSGSVGRLERNYLYKTGSGVVCHSSDLSAAHNLVYSCSRRYSPSTPDSTLGLYAGLAVKGEGKVQLLENLVKQCDVGIHISQAASPAEKANVIDSSFYAGVFAEQEAKPNIVSNTFHGGEGGPLARGLGLLFILAARGMVGKNQFEDYTVSPVMVFTRCTPMLRHNTYLNIHLSDERQATLETDLLRQFSTELEQDSYFYILDSAEKEEKLWEVILRGPNNEQKLTK